MVPRNSTVIASTNIVVGFFSCSTPSSSLSLKRDCGSRGDDICLIAGFFYVPAMYSQGFVGLFCLMLAYLGFCFVFVSAWRLTCFMRAPSLPLLFSFSFLFLFFFLVCKTWQFFGGLHVRVRADRAPLAGQASTESRLPMGESSRLRGCLRLPASPPPIPCGGSTVVLGLDYQD